MERNDFKAPLYAENVAQAPVPAPARLPPTSARLLTVSAGVVLVSARSARLYVHSMSAGCLPGLNGIKQDHFRLVLSVSAGGVCRVPPPPPPQRCLCVFFAKNLEHLYEEFLQKTGDGGGENQTFDGWMYVQAEEKKRRTWVL